MIGIYKITNKKDGKIYIGQSVHVQERMKQHGCKCLRWYIDRAIAKYGRQNFSYEILEECTIDELDERQRYYISLYKSNIRQFGYNQTSGGSPKAWASKRVICLQTLQIFDSCQQVQREKGISEGDMSRCCNGRLNSVGGMHFQFYQNYINGTMKLKEILPHPSKAKRVKCIQTNQVFESCHQAAKQLGLKFRNISACCIGTQDTHGGMHFQYV